MSNNPPERRNPDWWALTPAVTRRGSMQMRVGTRSRVTNHYLVEVTRDVTHIPDLAADELDLRIGHKLSEIVDDYELIHSDSTPLSAIYEDTFAGRRLLQQSPP